jgi:hypothetical protein
MNANGNTIVAHDAKELRALITEWLDAKRASEWMQKNVKPDVVVVNIFYTSTNDATMNQMIHTRADVLRAALSTEYKQQDLFKVIK